MHQYGAGTNVGNSRDNNEDSYVCDLDKELWLVADGMGGLGFGEVASAITAYTVTTLIREGHGVNQAIELAHREIKDFADRDAMGTNMGTTIVLLLSQGSLYNVFWVGDSRAYLYEHGNLNQMTVDHSLVQSLIDQGEITQAQAESDPRRNAVTRALGVHELETVRADSISNRWLPEQKVLLCSDGLTDCVPDSEIEAILGQEGTDQEKVDLLIETALERGGNDNITAIVVSAPDSARLADSDTESPNRHTRGDDTQTPDDDTGERDRDPDKGYTSPDDNTRARAAIWPADDVPERTEGHINTSRDTAQPAWQKMLLAITAIAAVIIFANLNTSEPDGRSDEPLLPSTSVPPDAYAVDPRPAKTIPEFPQPTGTRLQVGVFSALESAEFQQRGLSQLGLTPWVRKRPTNEGVLYVVLRGPYDDEKERQSAIEKLDANNLEYFQRSPKG